MINCIIVDDEPLARDILEGHILKQPNLCLSAKCGNAVEAFELIHKEPIDLMFLDIKMPGISGIDFLKSLKMPPKVVFCTAYSEYAVTGFEMDAVDYLLKPVTYERFQKCMNKLFNLRVSEGLSVSEYTYFKVAGKLVKINHDQLVYAQSVKDYILIQTSTGSHLTHMTMKALEQLLPATTFLRVHRSYLVNKLHVEVIGKTSLKVAGEEIPVGENYRAIVKGSQGYFPGDPLRFI